METLTVHAYDWMIEDGMDVDENVSIYAWCLDRASKPYLLRFHDFPAFCHVELPIYVGGRMMHWNKHNTDQYVGWLKKVLGEDGPMKGMFKMAPKLYYYRGGRKFPMLLLTFKRLESMKRCENFLSKPHRVDNIGMVAAKVWETDITVVRKMLTLRNCQYSQWFNVSATIVPEDERISTLDMEYICSWRTMTQVSAEESKSWTTYPGVLSFDIECYSDNHKAMPNKYNSKHVAYIITCVYQRLGNKNTRKKYCILYGDCDEVEGSEIIKVHNEIELCSELARIVRETDPEILTGYNIFAFDYPYLDARLKRRLQEWQPMGRIINKKPVMTNKTWKSNAYGHQDNSILQMEGRISIDMLPIIKRDYKLVKYDLDTVSNHFLKRGKHDIKAKQMFEIYEKYLKSKEKYESTWNELLECDTLNVDDTMRKMEGYDKLEKLRQLEEIWKDETITKKVDTIIEEYKEAKRLVTLVVKYGIEDSDLVLDLFAKVNVWIGLIELSNIVGVTIMELFTRGQQIRCLSQIYDLAASKGIIIDKRTTVDKSFKGGYVHPPEPGIDDYVLCLDFKSLYPSIIEAFNICYSTLVPPELENQIPDDKCHVIEWTEMEEDDNEDEEEDMDGTSKKNEKSTGKIKNFRFKYIKDEVGLLPQLVHKLVNERNNVRASMKGEKDEVVLVVLDKRQLALKVSANSMFGFLAANMLPLPEGAMCITAKGRELITTCNTYLIEKRDARIVYNDTDSTMFTLPCIKSNEETLEWGKKLEKEISDLFPDPLNVEFEKGGRMFRIAKKKYAFWPLAWKTVKDETGKDVKKAMLKLDADGNPDMITRGIILARRDNCMWQRKVYNKILNNVMNMKPLEETLDIMIEEIMNILQRNVSWRDLVIVRELGANYKSASYFMKIFSDELRRIGKPANPGDRLDYLIVKSGQNQLLGYKMRLPDTYLERLDTENAEQIDTEYYIEKILKNCIEQLIYCGYKQEIDTMTAKYKIQDYLNVFKQLEYMGYKDFLDQLRIHFGDNVEDMFKYLEQCNIKYFSKIKTHYITRRNRLTTRISKEPIKTLLKTIAERQKYIDDINKLNISSDK